MNRLLSPSWNLLLNCVMVTFAVALSLSVSGCAQGEAQRDANRNGIDSRLTGAWLLLKQSNVSPSGFVPPAVNAVYIHEDGRMEGVGVHAATGRLKLGYPLQWSFFGRRIIRADSSTIQCTQLDVQSREPELCEGRWRRDDTVLRLTLRNAFFGKWTEEYVRTALGDSVALPLRIRAAILLDGKPLPLVDVSSTPPGSVNVMRLDTATHMTVQIEGKTAEGRRMRISVRVHNIKGPGVYHVEVEQGAHGCVTSTDERNGVTTPVRWNTAGTVIIEELNIETLRCRGKLELLYEQKSSGGSPLRVTGSFDFPVWLSNEYDVKIHRINLPPDKLDVEVP